MIKIIKLFFFFSLTLFSTHISATNNKESLLEKYNSRIIDNYLSIYNLSNDLINKSEDYCKKRKSLFEI